MAKRIVGIIPYCKFVGDLECIMMALSEKANPKYRTVKVDENFGNSVKGIFADDTAVRAPAKGRKVA